MTFDIGAATLSPTCTAYLQAIEEMCGENIYAQIWLKQVVQVALVWDHVVDNDPIDREKFDSAMTALATEWPLNPFLRKSAESLIPTVVASISAWKHNESRDLHYSIYREVPAAAAFVLGGNPLVEKFMPRIAELVQKMREEDDVRDKPKEVIANG